MVRRKKLSKIICEICGETNVSVLHKHHIIERTNPNTSHDDINLAIICANCHHKVHAGEVKIIGVFPSTQLPYARTLVYEIGGVCNVPGITEAYWKPKPKKVDNDKNS